MAQQAFEFNGVDISGTTGTTITFPSSTATLVGLATTDTLTNKTISSGVLTGTLTAGGGVGTNGQVLQSTGTGVQWGTVSGYSAPTIGSTLISSGATVTTISGLILDESILSSPEERWNVQSESAGMLSVTVDLDAKTSGILYYTSNSSGNWTLNIRGDATTTLNSMLAINDSITVVFFVTNGSTARYQTGFQIDGSNVTPKWQNGTAPSSGNANSIDVYSYTIVKTANATFTAFGSQTKFA